eukprot:Rmarinus@m.10600
MILPRTHQRGVSRFAKGVPSSTTFSKTCSTATRTSTLVCSAVVRWGKISSGAVRRTPAFGHTSFMGTRPTSRRRQRCLRCMRRCFKREARVCPPTEFDGSLTSRSIFFDVLT